MSIGAAIQPPHPLSAPSPPTLSLSQHQGLFQWAGSSHQVAKVLEFQFQHPSFQRLFRVDTHFKGPWMVPSASQESMPWALTAETMVGRRWGAGSVSITWEHNPRSHPNRNGSESALQFQDDFPAQESLVSAALMTTLPKVSVLCPWCMLNWGYRLRLSGRAY